MDLNAFLIIENSFLKKTFILDEGLRKHFLKNVIKIRDASNLV